MILSNMDANQKTTFYSLIGSYNTLAYTHNYIFGYAYNGNVYFSFAINPKLDTLTYLDKSSKSKKGEEKGYCLKYRPNKEQIKELYNNNHYLLCTLEAFENAKKAVKHNRGELFESFIFQHFGQTWKKDNIPFTDAGDITINGIAYQIKYNKASFINQYQVEKMTSKKC